MSTIAPDVLATVIGGNIPHPPTVPQPQPAPGEPFPRTDLPTYPPSGGPSSPSAPKNDWLPVTPSPLPGMGQ
jgi:hypothetical protein